MRAIRKWSLPAFWVAVYIAGIFVLPARANNVPPTPFNSFYGDATGDMIIDVSELSKMKSWTLGLPYSYDTIQPQNATQDWNTSDVTSDNLIDASDLSAIRSWTLGFSVTVEDKPWVLSNENLPTSIAANTPIAFQINLASTLGTQFGRAGLPVIANIDAANSTATGSLGGRTCSPIGGSRDQQTLAGDQCAISVTVTDWTGASGPTKGLTETGTYGFSVTGITPGNLRIVFSISGNPPGLDIPAITIGLNVTIEVSDQIAINCPASVNETDSISCAVVTATGPGSCSIAPGDTCGGTIDPSCVGPYTAPMPGEAKGPGSCVAAVIKGTASDTHNIIITEVNQNPTISVNCPASAPETSASICPLVVSDPDLPAQVLTCEKNAATTCIGVTLTGCSQVNIPAQGEIAGPGSCLVVVDIRDNFTPAGTGQGSATITINEDNRTPTWYLKTSNIFTKVAQPYNQNNGRAKDYDLPNTMPSDPGYLTCSKTYQTCSFDIAVSGSGSGSGIMFCSVSFTAGSEPENCSVDMAVTDGYGATITAHIWVTVTSSPFTWYVNVNATGNKTGISWADALTDVQSAINVAASGDMVWVAEGNYSNSVGNTKFITMKDGVDLYGGFIGTESDFSQRPDPFLHPTILDCHSYDTVITGSSNAHLDGFKIINGGLGFYVPGYGDGGGMIINNVSNLSVTNCIFSNNVSVNYAGGMKNFNSTNLIIKNCIFENNSSGYYYCIGECGPVPVRYGDPYGGAIYNSFSSPSIINCIFVNNSTATNGGGINNYYSSPTIINCTFNGNKASGYGGAISKSGTSAPTIINSILWGDIATSGSPEISEPSSSVIITFSDIQGGHGGTGNINVNPQLAAPPDVFILSSSPCKDTGTPAGAPPDDIEGILRPQGSGIDMGAYEYKEKLWFVDIDATGASTGLTWVDAFNNIGEALEVATSGDTIWVAEGTYINQAGNTNPVISMRNNIYIYGGFNGTESSLSERGNLNLHPTILDGQNISYHVVVGASNAVLDGFIITGGNASAESGDDSSGGGMLCDSKSALSIANCIFKNNSARSGGAMFNDNSNLVMNNCVLTGNSSTGISTSCGGAIFTYQGSITILYCTFSGNSANGAQSYGGAIYKIATPTTIKNSILWGDTALTGPEIYISSSAPSSTTYSDIQGGYSGTGNINLDPLFVGYPDVHLQSGSPCKNSGIASEPYYDRDQYLRPYGGGYDMGAYEWHP